MSLYDWGAGYSVENAADNIRSEGKSNFILLGLLEEKA